MCAHVFAVVLAVVIGKCWSDGCEITCAFSVSLFTVFPICIVAR